jgi:SH3 domain-containing YSC84-like protein 1
MRGLVLLAASVAGFGCLVWAADEAKELDSAAQVLQNTVSSHQIPGSLLDQTKCIAVVPRLIKGGKQVNGVVSCRTASGWSAPAFISLSGESVHSAAEHQDLILLMNSQGADELKNGHWDLGASASAPGPSGGHEATPGSGWSAPVLSYSNSDKAFAGADVDGSTIDADKDAIHNTYGENATFQGVMDGQVQPPAAADQFMSALPNKRELD